MRIAFVNGKGGVGKSTLCYLVGLALQDAGKRVRIVDRDPQKSISAWIRPERDGITLEETEGVNCTLVDTRPTLDDSTIPETIREATHVVLPCSPSPGDVTTIGATAAVVREFLAPGAKAMIALNMVKAKTILAEDAPELLREQIGLPVLKTAIPDRQCIQRAILSGWKGLDPETQTEFFKLALEVTA